MTTATDILLLGVLSAGLIVLGLAGFLLRSRWMGILTTREWRVFGKVVGALVFWFLLVVTNIATELPAGMFIYGRF